MIHSWQRALPLESMLTVLFAERFLSQRSQRTHPLQKVPPVEGTKVIFFFERLLLQRSQR
jgi:hypothetical protein